MSFEAGVGEGFCEEKKNSVKMKSVFVTGGNTGIGEALCRILVRDHGCYVYLGSRNVERGAKAVADIKEQVKFL